MENWECRPEHLDVPLCVAWHPHSMGVTLVLWWLGVPKGWSYSKCSGICITFYHSALEVLCCPSGYTLLVETARNLPRIQDRGQRPHPLLGEMSEKSRVIIYNDCSCQTVPSLRRPWRHAFQGFKEMERFPKTHCGPWDHLQHLEISFFFWPKNALWRLFIQGYPLCYPSYNCAGAYFSRFRFWTTWKINQYLQLTL